MRHPISFVISFAFALALTAAGCGGGGGGGNAVVVPEPPATLRNQLPVVVEAGPADTVNTPFVSVTICQPGTNVCQTIEHIILDTGSNGLRIVSSALAPSINLPLVPAGSGGTLAECMQFVGGYTWGALRSADVRLAGHTLDALSVQIIGDTTAGGVPAACASTGPGFDTVQAFGGNGILGVGHFEQDCGPACTVADGAGVYYACSSGSCRPASVPLTRQVHNPVALLGSDNNGVVVELPPVASSGAASARGMLTLGIGTQSNNRLGNATVIGVDTAQGTFTTRFNGTDYSGFIDSGSNGLFFPSDTLPSDTLPVCNGFYCPITPQPLTAMNLGTNGATSAVNFEVDNVNTLAASGNVAFNNLGGPAISGSYFDWGLPFFFGRTVFTAIEYRSTPGGAGPYVAY